MDGSRFDRLTRSLVGSRRAVLRGLAASAAAGVAAALGLPAAARPNRVTVCHKGREKKVPARFVTRHLRHGDELGGCGKPVGEACRFNADCWSGFCDRSTTRPTCQCPPERPRVCEESRTCCPACNSCPRPLSTTCGSVLRGCEACTANSQCGAEGEACCNTCPGRYCRTCTNIVDDPRNCGACGNACPAERPVCRNNACVAG